MPTTNACQVLVVDDSLFMRSELRGLLERNGFAVCAEARNGLEAIKAYRESRPDVVLLDIVMPVMDGISTLKALRDMDPAANVIMISSMSIQQKVVAATRAGAKAFIAKPFKEEDVIESIRGTLDPS